MVHLVRKVYNKAPYLGLTEGVAEMAAEAAATCIGGGGGNDVHDNHRLLEGQAGQKAEVAADQGSWVK